LAQITKTEVDHHKVDSTSEETRALLEVGFKYICEKEGLMFFRKRK
jgi:hypothetical protein